ncbi:hypothetical protein [Allomuricauda sp. SCSIO 65647]|uniref:hypothetical protein n=1 Tax=Allomuricauda sp. SCSIO 65647 TaxID=2908843 RepID=UPI001F3AA3BB|nr:hypothetical protein [Muricauda sp. SCSIO 65647]UJH68720.1 hypothetical protein L0P89_05770 [Muricauda sp. SCSIO 65647]
MKRIVIQIAVLLCLPAGLWAQVDDRAIDESFYSALAKADAHYEQSLPAMSIEDELDFWNDQEAFEQRLSKTNPRAYQIYLNSKGNAYREYLRFCGSECQHGDQFFRKASFYMINGEVEDEMAFSTTGKKSLKKN